MCSTSAVLVQEKKISKFPLLSVMENDGNENRRLFSGVLAFGYTSHASSILKSLFEGMIEDSSESQALKLKNPTSAQSFEK